MPLHTIIQIVPEAYFCVEDRYVINPEKGTTVRVTVRSDEILTSEIKPF